MKQLTIVRQRISASPRDLPQGLPDTKANVYLLLRDGARTYPLQAVCIGTYKRTQHVGTERICEHGQTLDGIQEYVRIVVLNGLQEHLADGRLECAHCLVWHGACAGSNQLSQEEQAVRADWEQCVLEKFECSLVRGPDPVFLWLASGS
jgi:hypothetical protein